MLWGNRRVAGEKADVRVGEAPANPWPRCGVPAAFRPASGRLFDQIAQFILSL